MKVVLFITKYINKTIIKNNNKNKGKKMFEETNNKLREYLVKFIAVLDNHHQYSKTKWLAREISKACYENVHQRFVVAKMLNDKTEIKDEQLVHVCAELTVDIHSSVDILSEEEKETYDILIEEWYGIFRKIGYIDIHPVFRKPEKNLTAFEEFEKRHKK